MKENMKITDQDFPYYFRSTDSNSLEGQQSYLIWIKLELLILLVSSIVSVLNFTNTDYARWQAAGAALVFVVGIGVTVYLKNQKFENAWYIGRALAESIKSLTWKYMTKGEPFVQSMSLDEADKLLIRAIKEMLDENKEFTNIIFNSDSNSDVITNRMRELRSSCFAIRKATYIEGRVKDQREWYRKKASYNQGKSNQVFWIAIATQFLALIYSVYLIIRPEAFSAVPVLSTVAAIVFTWLQIKRHQELSQSYAVAFNDINLILAEAEFIENEKQFEVFVADSETAFSREHTLWIARRDVAPQN